MPTPALLRRREVLAGAAASAASLALPAFAQATDSPIRIVVPFPPGGVLDAMVRMLGQRLTTSLKQTVIVDNRAGAGGNIGSDFVAKAKPDGLTVLISGVSLVSAPLLVPGLPYLPTRDFTPVAMLGSTPGTLVANAVPGVPFRNVKELVAYSRANPGKLSYATAGNGSLGHMLGSWINQVAGTDLLHVPYKGGSAAAIDVIAGRVPLWIDVASNREMILAGKVKCLAVTSAQRTSVLPDVPTLQEQGVNVDGFTWWAMMAPAGTPRPQVDRLSNAIGAIINSAEGKAEFERLAIDRNYRTPDDFQAFFKSENAKWSRIIRENNITGGA
jgi:tripartite-type tricarboxylate transporter receptor subunit TctC